MSHVTHINESCHTYEKVMSHINESPHTYEKVMPHISMSHVTHAHESCLRTRSQRMGFVVFTTERATHIYESCHTYQ